MSIGAVFNNPQFAFNTEEYNAALRLIEIITLLNSLTLYVDSGRISLEAE